jgi:hypothetical protein
MIKSKRMRWVGHVALMGEMRNAYVILIGKPEGKIPFEGPSRRGEDNTRKDLREIGWKGVNWTHLLQVEDHWWVVVNLRVP